MEKKTPTIVYILLTLVAVLIVVMLYMYAQVLWQQQREPVAAVDPVAPTETETGYTAAERQAILNQETPSAETISSEERKRILDSDGETETRDVTLSQEERQALLDQ